MKVCVVTGTRAEYGLLRPVIDGITRSERLELQVIATGMHLSPEFGLTKQEIESDGYGIDRKVEMLLSSDTATGVAKSIGLGVIGFADAFEAIKPDLVLVLGDRFEILAACTAAMVARLPIAHVHGGETTEGAIDEAIRHSVTKMSHLHFVATEIYRDRVIQLGETPQNVHIVGGLGIDSLLRTQLLSTAELQRELGVTFAKRKLLVTFHPVTLEQNTAEFQTRELLSALGTLEDTTLIFTMPNADTDGRTIYRIVSDFCRTRENAVAFTSLGHLRYFSCMSLVDAVVGNSSSGLLEAPSFRIGTINIGDRQTGRLKAQSVIDCEPNRNAIDTAFKKLYSTEFQLLLEDVQNPYGSGGASEKIVSTLEHVDLSNILKKRFFDLPCQQSFN